MGGAHQAEVSLLASEKMEGGEGGHHILIFRYLFNRNYRPFLGLIFETSEET